MSFSLNKELERTVARVAGKSPEMDIAAEKVKNEVISQATPHRATGHFIDSVKVTKTNMDRVVYTDDKGAFAIEFGHDSPNGGRIQAQQNFRKAVNKWR